VGELDDPVVVAFPLRGEWTVERSPADRIPSHGTDAFGQRFAYDLVRTDGRHGLRMTHVGSVRRWLTGAPTRGYFAWGQPVRSALDGQVVAAVDEVPERRRIHPLLELWFAIRTTRAFIRGRSRDAALLAGNHVIVSSGDVHALYAHLAPGSVAVTPGATVAAGEMIGRVGHTGNSTAPHLHFQLMDAADPFAADGLPCAFAAYLIERGSGWERVGDGIPGRRERLRSID